MLASLNSFLPSVLQTAHEHKRGEPNEDPPDQDQRDRAEDDTAAHSDPDITMTVNESDTKKKEKKDKSPSETFIIVRPPPAKSNHPLNLQVQLVPPHSRTPSGPTGSINSRQSIDYPITPLSSTFTEPNTPTTDTEQDPTDLSRVASGRSEASGYSSVASFSSTSSSTGGRRMIIPLYNLQAHNVMTNTIVDAGTDAKIAKFQKRGMELIGLAVLEPVEVWDPNCSVSPGTEDGRGSPTSSRDRDRGLLRPGQLTEAHTSGSSALSLSSAGTDAHSRQQDETHITEAATSRRNIFGKLFKKKDISPHPSHLRSPSIPASSAPTSKRISTISAISNLPSSGFPFVPTPNGDPDPPTTSILRPPVLGIQPTLSSPRYPPTGRPSMYVWVVRRWLKGHDSSIIGGMIGKIGAQVPGIGQMGTSTGLVEVRFEWKRGKTSAGRNKKKVPRGRKAITNEAGNTAENRRDSMLINASNTSLARIESPAAVDAHLPTMKQRNRLSQISHHSISTTQTSEEDRERERARGSDDAGDESDPEDTETPWTCTLKISRAVPLSPRTPTPASSRLEGGRKALDAVDQVIRTKLATLSPTPHHPKVVAMLKVPFPLPDIEVDNLLVRKRFLGPGGGVLRSGDNGGLMLTAEEIKDVVCSTGLWLVVREGFGGVGKVSRKGDGWRIRA